MKNKLLPLNTELITSKLTYASMCNDYFGDGDMQSLLPSYRNITLGSAYDIEPTYKLGFDKKCSKWKIKVTARQSGIVE